MNASRELISNVTDVVVDEIKARQSRPLDEVYPILYIDCIRLRIKDNGVVTTKVGYLAIGVDVDGRKHALGCWIQDTEGAKFWAKILADLRNREVKDILIACCDGLTGLPDAIRSIFPDTVVQTCVVHYSDVVVMPMWGRRLLFLQFEVGLQINTCGVHVFVAEPECDDGDVDSGVETGALLRVPQDVRCDVLTGASDGQVSPCVLFRGS